MSKVAETIPVATKAAKSNAPFFDKKGGSAFASAGETTSPFFIQNKKLPEVQAKLNIGQPNDKYEQEADAVADKVVQRLAMPEAISLKAPDIQSKPLASTVTPLVQAKCAHCEQEEKLQKKEEGIEEYIQRKPVFESKAMLPEEVTNVQRKCTHCEEEETLQKKGDNNSAEKTASSSLESQLSSSKGSGFSLAEQVNTSMSNEFGTDFSHVRIHTGSSAVQMSKDLGAQAFTHGSDIYFNAGKYDSHSSSGRHLLAHELTHTIQQNGAAPGLTKKNMIQQVCDHGKCSGDHLTPSCPAPRDFLLDDTLRDIRYAYFNMVKGSVVLQKGETSKAVSLVKKLILNKHCEGYNREAVENEPEFHFGADTKTAVIYFQLHHQDTNGNALKADGKIGHATLGAMDGEVGISAIPEAKAPENKGDCFGVAEQGPGLTKKWNMRSPDYLWIKPFAPASQTWEISNFDIDKHFLKTEHRAFLQSTVVPEIKDAILKAKTKSTVRIIGEASTTASDAHNKHLSLRRANCLRAALVELGVDEGIIESPVSALGEQLARFEPVLRHEANHPVDNVEDFRDRRVTIVLSSECDKTRASTDFVAFAVCNTPGTYLITIVDLTDQASPMYREFLWGHDNDTTGCDFSPEPPPGNVFKVVPGMSLQLAKSNPDNPLAPSDFEGLTKHSFDKRGMMIEKQGAFAPFSIFVYGDFSPADCKKDNSVNKGLLVPISPVICAMPKPPKPGKCKAEEDCPPEKKQRPAKKFTASMQWISVDIVKLLKKIPAVKKLTKKIDDFLKLFGIDINSSVTAAHVRIGTTDDKDNPIARTFYFGGGEITGSTLPLFDMGIVFAEPFDTADPKQLQTPKGDSDFSGIAHLVIKGGSNRQELRVKGLDKPIVFKGLTCDPGGDKESTGYLGAQGIDCEKIISLPIPDEKCEEEKEDCPDSKKLKEDDHFVVKTGRATIADLPVAGKLLADKLGCGVTAAFINIGTNIGDAKDKIFRKFIFVGKNHECRYTVEKSNTAKEFIIPRALAYPDPNDIFSLSDFSGLAKLQSDKNLAIISSTNFPVNFKLPGAFDGNCPTADATGLVIPVSATDCGLVPDPPHNTAPDITDLDKCEAFKKTHTALVTTAIADLKGKYSKLVNAITDPPRLDYPLYNELFYAVGKSISNAVFFGKAYDGQNVVTIADMAVLSVFPDANNGYVFNVKFLSLPCSYNEAGETVFVLPKDCKESYITIEGDYTVYPIPDLDDRLPEDDTIKKDEPATPAPRKNEKCHGDCHSEGIIPTQQDAQLIRLKEEPGYHGSTNVPHCDTCHSNPIQTASETHNVQRKCAACEEEVQIQKKSTGAGGSAGLAQVESSLHAAQRQGLPMPTSERQQMEHSIGADFSAVRIHIDQAAAGMSSNLHAKAFTHGSDIYFSKGAYQPATKEGQHLLAHELTHVLQQKNGDEMIARKIELPFEQSKPFNSNNPGTATQGKTAESLLNKLCAGGGITVSKGVVVVPPDLCDLPGPFGGNPALTKAEQSTTKVGCTCLCELVESDKIIKLIFNDDTAGTTLAENPGAEKPGVGSGSIINVPSEDAPKTELPTKSGTMLPVDPVVNLGHELCGHAFLNERGQGAQDFNAQRGRGGHQAAIDRENLIRDEQGVERRASFRDPFCGETTGSTFLDECQIWRNEYNRLNNTLFKIADSIPANPSEDLPADFRIDVFFNKDMPLPGSDPDSSFNASVTARGKEFFSFATGVFADNPDKHFQLEAHASSDKPAGNEDYNTLLSERRLQVILHELLKKNIDPQRLLDKDDSCCDTIDTGLKNCSDTEAGKPGTASDRKVVIRIF